MFMIIEWEVRREYAYGNKLIGTNEIENNNRKYGIVCGCQSTIFFILSIF